MRDAARSPDVLPIHRVKHSWRRRYGGVRWGHSAPSRSGRRLACPSSDPLAWLSGPTLDTGARVVDEGRLRDFVARALLLVSSLVVLVIAATVGGLSIRASVLLALGLLMPGLLWLALRP